MKADRARVNVSLCSSLAVGMKALPLGKITTFSLVGSRT